MAEALARGFINKGVIKSENIFATDPVPARKDVFTSFGTNAKDTNGEVRCLLYNICIFVTSTLYSKRLVGIASLESSSHSVLSCVASDGPACRSSPPAMSSLSQ